MTVRKSVPNCRCKMKRVARLRGSKAVDMALISLLQMLPQCTEKLVAPIQLMQPRQDLVFVDRIKQ